MDMRLWGRGAIVVVALGWAIWEKGKVPGLRRIIALRLLVGAAFVALTFWIATGIDDGVWRGQPHTDRMILVAAMMLSMIGGIITIVSIIWLQPGDGPLPGRALLWTGVAGVAMMLLVEVGRYGERQYGVYNERIFLFTLGLAIATCTLIRPWWFWDHPKATFVRHWLGDTPTMVLYLGIAGGILWYAAIPRWMPQTSLQGSANGFKGAIGQCLELQRGRSDSLGLPGTVAWQPGFETGFALWMSRTPDRPPTPEAMKDTIQTTAFEGRWYRTKGDSLEILFTSDQREGMARLVVAPGPFPRAAYLEADPATFGHPMQGGIRVLQTAVDSVSCRVEIR